MKKRGILGIAVAVAVGMAMATLLQFPVPVYAANVVEINDSTFPDAAFQSYVRGKSIDKNGDGLLSVEEQEAVTSIWVNGKNISSLQGIEYFPNLKTLVAQKNNLTSIDLSQNTKLESLTIHTNQLSELTISANTELKTLSCYNNHIPKINVTYCYKLKDAVEKGDRTTVVDGTTEYDKILGDYGTIYLDVDTDTIIEVEGIPVDEDHFPDANFRSYLLNVLDDDKNTYLSDAEIFQTEIINVSGYEITSLKGVEYFTNIYKLDASQNFLSGLDISKNVKLNYLYLNNNDITMIDLSDNTALMDVKFSNNPNLVSLDFSDTTILANIECNNCTKLASLTIGKRGELKSLSCTNSALTSIDIIGCDSLKKLLCYGNPMTKLDIRGCNLLIEAFEKATVDTTNPVGANTYNYGTVLSYPATAELIAYDSENWTVSFDGNGGTGTMNSLVVTDGDAITLPTCEFTAPEGKVFDSWNVGKPGDQITVNNNIEVKAVWKNLYAVQLSSNLSADAIETLTGEGTYVDGSSVTVSVSLKEGQRYVFRCWKNTATNTIVSTAPSYTFAITGATSLSAEFAEAEKAEGPVAPTGLTVTKASSATAADGAIQGVDTTMEYATKDDFSDAVSVTGTSINGLTAGTYYVRVKETETTKAGAAATVTVTVAETYFTVSFDEMGGSDVADQSVKQGEKAGEPSPASAKEGLYLLGWFTGNNSADVPFDFANTAINQNTELYARWAKVLSVQIYNETASNQENGGVIKENPDAVSGLGGFDVYSEELFKNDLTYYAVPDNGYHFVGWRKNATTGEFFATDATLVLKWEDYANYDTVYAVFAQDEQVDDTLTLTFKHNCSFGNNLSFYFAVPASSLEGYVNIRLSCEKRVYNAEGDSFSTKTNVLTNYSLTKISNVDYIMFEYNNIAAKEMGDEITAKVLADKDNVTRESNTDTYCIRQYAYERLENSTKPVFKTLVVDMLNYGASAQIHFGYNTNHLVNSALTDEQKALGTSALPELVSVTNSIDTEGATVQIIGKNVVFGNNIELVFAMTFPDQFERKNAKLEISYISTSNEPKSVSINCENLTETDVNGVPAYSGKINTISAKDLGVLVTAKITDLDGKVISNVQEYSVESYAKSRLEKSTDENFKALTTCLMKYGKAAEAYFSNSN